MDNSTLLARIEALEERETRDFNALRQSQIQWDNAARSEVQAMRRQMLALEVRIEQLEARKTAAPTEAPEQGGRHGWSG